MGMQDPPTGTFTCLDMRRPRRYIILITSEAVLLAIAAELAVQYHQCRAERLDCQRAVALRYWPKVLEHGLVRQRR